MAGEAKTAFLVLIPARNEGRVIADTLHKLQSLDYPAEKRRLVVIADDCSDDTAQAAVAAGAQVLVKPGPATGKGRAIQWALAQDAVTSADWQALVIFDADSRPRSDFYAMLDGALSRGAQAIQGRTESLPPVGWVARAYALNTSQRNRLWHQARERAGFSAALTGTGVCLARPLLERMPLEPQTLTEDLEYSALVTSAGTRVEYLYDAVLEVEQPHSLASSLHQRIRWARGQMMTTLGEGPKLLLRAVRRLDFSALDTALYLAMPSLVPLQAVVVFWLGVSLIFDTSGLRSFNGVDPLPLPALGAAFGLSVIMPYLGIIAESRRASPGDWLGFFVLMATWIPLAVYAALTAFVRNWRPTPHGVHSDSSVAGPATDELPALDVERALRS